MPRVRRLRRPPARLSAGQVAAYDRDGAVLPLRACPPAEAAAVLRRIEDAERAEGKGGMAIFSNAHLTHAWWHGLCTRPEVLDVVEDLLGPNLLIWKSQLWIKEPGPAYVGWHQDATYWGLDPPDAVNVWIALTDVTATHGPLRLLRGSHKGALRTRDTYEVDNILTRGQELEDWGPARGPPEADVCDAVLRPGEFEAHHLGIAHSSRPNRGPGRRVGFNVTFVAPHMRNIRQSTGAQLVRGADRLGHWALEPAPGDAAAAGARAAKGRALTETVMVGADMPRFLAVSRERARRNLAPTARTSVAARSAL